MLLGESFEFSADVFLMEMMVVGQPWPRSWGGGVCSDGRKRLRFTHAEGRVTLKYILLL